MKLGESRAVLSLPKGGGDGPGAAASVGLAPSSLAPERSSAWRSSGRLGVSTLRAEIGEQPEPTLTAGNVEPFL